MKRVISLIGMALLGFFLMCCTKKVSNSLIEFDVKGNFPEMIMDIQDVADVEYLALETHDDYLFSYFISMSDSYVICGNNVESSFVFFNRKTGEVVSKINRYGNGPEEYNIIPVKVYSEREDEFFILDWPQGIKVYTRNGTFKRKLPMPITERLYPSGSNALYDYDSDNLLLNFFLFNGEMKDTSFVLVSKQDGHTEKVYIPYKEKVDLMFTQAYGNAMAMTMPETYFAVRNGKDFLLTDYSSDTVYRFTPDHQLTPVLVRKPSIQSSEKKIILHSWLETDKYLFFSTEKVEFDWNSQEGFPKKVYLMEKRTGKFFQTKVQMKEYKGKELILGPSVLSQSSDLKTGIIVLPALELTMANEDDKLSGKLKEAADHLTDDDQFLLMILKFK